MGYSYELFEDKTKITTISRRREGNQGLGSFHNVLPSTPLSLRTLKMKSFLLFYRRMKESGKLLVVIFSTS